MPDVDRLDRLDQVQRDQAVYESAVRDAQRVIDAALARSGGG